MDHLVSRFLTLSCLTSCSLQNTVDFFSDIEVLNYRITRFK